MISSFFYSYLDTTRCHRTAPPDQPLPGERSAQSPGYEQVGTAYQGWDGYEREVSASALKMYKREKHSATGGMLFVWEAETDGE